MTPEGKVKAKLNKALLKEFGDRCYRFMPVQMGLGASTLDYLLCIDGQFIAIETKAPGKHLTDRQQAVVYTIRQAGGWTFVVSDDDGISGTISAIRVLFDARNSI